MSRSLGLIGIVMILFVTACSSYNHRLDNNTNANVMTYRGNTRGAYILKKTDGENGYIILSEPSPDVAKEYNANIEISAKAIAEIKDPKAKVEFGSEVVDLAKRSQTLQILRESLFRLSEMIANGAVSDRSASLFERALKAVEMIAAVELGNSNLPLDSKKLLIQDFYGRVKPGSLTRTDSK